MCSSLWLVRETGCCKTSRSSSANRMIRIDAEEIVVGLSGDVIVPAFAFDDTEPNNLSSLNQCHLQKTDVV